jgi:hypothetical protein
VGDTHSDDDNPLDVEDEPADALASKETGTAPGDVR